MSIWKRGWGRVDFDTSGPVTIGCSVTCLRRRHRLPAFSNNTLAVNIGNPLIFTTHPPHGLHAGRLMESRPPIPGAASAKQKIARCSGSAYPYRVYRSAPRCSSTRWGAQRRRKVKQCISSDCALLPPQARIKVPGIRADAHSVRTTLLRPRLLWLQR
jgi:hypothetical protein